jgi:hypothetical protein
MGFIAFALIAIPGRAQDVDFGAFNDAPPPPPANAAPTRGAAPARGAPPAPPPVDRLVRLREVLLKAEAPLNKDQETALNALISAEIPAMRKTIQTHGQEMMAKQPAAPPSAPSAPVAAAPASPGPAAQAAAPAQAQAAAARGGALPPGGALNPAMLAAMAAARGASATSRVPAEVLDALEVEMRQLNDALFIKIASAPALDSKQQGVLTKMSRDQIKARGGYDALRVSMEDARAPFTDEQTPKVQAVFEDQKKARAELARASQGTPDPAKLKQLERDTLTKVVGILTPAQRTALLALLRAAQ